ncbi:MAG TPA: alpha/beta fold hydrolase [Anaerolineae bacterium]|nr:alpha/beta fold hydrolase [Anaerolineae bacterium]
MSKVFVLIHSPLVGPLTWALVSDELQRRGIETRAPQLFDNEAAGIPYWKQHADSVARALTPIPIDRSLILIGHSGAGPLLPAIRQALNHPIAGYIFADAGIPVDGASRLDLMASEDPEWAGQFRQTLEAGERFPNWRNDDLAEVIPEAALRQGVVNELRPRGLVFFEERIPVFDGWPDAPCGYLLFSPVYAAPAARARREGWAYREMQAGHFHMLVEPAAVANALVDLEVVMNEVHHHG